MKLKDGIIIILLFIIAVALGIFFGFKISEDKQSDNEVNQGNISNNNTDNKKDDNNEQEYSLAEATKLMEKYVLDNGCGEKYITDLSDETSKNYLSFKMTGSTETVACKVLENEGIAENKNSGEIILGQCFLDETNNKFKHSLYDYDSALKNKKVLFGNLSSLQKNEVDFDIGKYYYYSSTKNGFVQLMIPAGYDCSARPTSCGLLSASIIGNDLKILAYNTVTDKTTGKEIKETVNYEYTFKMQDTGYYLASIEEVK